MKTLKCEWCGTDKHLIIASKVPPCRYFCSYSCLHKWEWFNRNGQDWLNVEERNNGKKKS